MTGTFTPLVTEYIDGRNWLLAAVLAYTGKDGRCYKALAGFVTDFASIPRLFWRVAPPQGDGDGEAWAPAAVIHDAAYRDLLYDGAEVKLPLTKAQADALFLEMLEACGVGKVKRTAMYLAVKFFGRGHWSQPVTDGVA